MSESVVVCFRSPERDGDPGNELERLRAVVEQGASRGALLVAWSATGCAFELPTSGEHDAVELAAHVVRNATYGSDLSAGVSRGRLERTTSVAPFPLVLGVPLSRAQSFARAARPGEVLVDPALGVAQKGELLSAGSRVGVLGRQRVRALLVDPAHPFRTAIGRASRGAARAQLVGRPEIATLTIPGGSLALVRARRGHGGTRFLDEVEQALEPARILRVMPHPFAEPLGALRRSMLRAVTMGHAPLNLNGPEGEGLDALLAGEGLDPDSSAELLSAWLTPDSVEDPRGVVIVDDAGEVDADTLEVVARAVRSAGEPFRVVAHVGGSDAVPKALGVLPVAVELRLGPLSHADATKIAQDSAPGNLATEVATLWAVRGGRLPLGIVESVREAIDSGEIVWENGAVAVRLRASHSPNASVPLPPKHWVKKRLAHQDGGARRVLEALAILGGSAEVRDVLEVVRRREELDVDAATAVVVLEAGRFVVRVKPDVILLASTTHRDAILATLSDSDFQAWHRAASATFARRDRPLVVAAATVHSILASDPGRALELSRRAAAATRAIGLELTAEAFEKFYERQDVSALVGRNLFSSQLEIARALPSIWPDEVRSDSGMPRSPSSMPPRGASSLPPDRESILTLTESDITEIGNSSPEASSSPHASSPHASSPDASSPYASSPETTSAAVEALRNGDLEAVERMAKQVRLDENRAGLAERLSAMAKLARGETGDAIRRLRAAAEESRQRKSKDRCRASLALGVALAAANRHEEALFEALDALARAREHEDVRGEQACVRFLSQLAATVGHHDVAEAWATIAE